MNDDWRLQIDLQEESHVHNLIERLDARELEHDLSNSFGDRVIVTREGNRLFLYAGTREQAESARGLIGELTEVHGGSVETELRRWHQAAEDWEDPDAPLPDSEAAGEAEREELIATERVETQERGYPEFEVRVDFSSRKEAERFEGRLEAEGLAAVRRGKYLLVGATDEDSAKSLAERLREEAPADAEIKVEGTWKAALDERPPNPFAIFGGLGG